MSLTNKDTHSKLHILSRAADWATDFKTWPQKAIGGPLAFIGGLTGMMVCTAPFVMLPRLIISASITPSPMAIMTITLAPTIAIQTAGIAAGILAVKKTRSENIKDIRKAGRAFLTARTAILKKIDKHLNALSFQGAKTGEALLGSVGKIAGIAIDRTIVPPVIAIATTVSGKCKIGKKRGLQAARSLATTGTNLKNTFFNEFFEGLWKQLQPDTSKASIAVKPTTKKIQQTAEPSPVKPLKAFNRWTSSAKTAYAAATPYAPVKYINPHIKA